MTEARWPVRCISKHVRAWTAGAWPHRGTGGLCTVVPRVVPPWGCGEQCCPSLSSLRGIRWPPGEDPRQRARYWPWVWTWARQLQPRPPVAVTTHPPTGAHTQGLTTPATVISATWVPPSSSSVFSAAPCPTARPHSAHAKAPPESPQPPPHRDAGTRGLHPADPSGCTGSGLAAVACSGLGKGTWHCPSGFPWSLTLAHERPLLLQGQTCFAAAWA